MTGKKLFKDTKAKVAASAIGGVLVILLSIVCIWLWSATKQDKSSITLKSRMDLPEPTKGGVNTSEQLLKDSYETREIHVITKGAEKENESSFKNVVNSTVERKNQEQGKITKLNKNHLRAKFGLNLLVLGKLHQLDCTIATKDSC